MLSAGFALTKAQVIRVVHVGEATLDKRVSEFTNTDEASLTAIEFKSHIEQEVKQQEEHLLALEGPSSSRPALEGPVIEGCTHVSKFRFSLTSFG